VGESLNKPEIFLKEHWKSVHSHATRAMSMRNESVTAARAGPWDAHGGSFSQNGMGADDEISVLGRRRLLRRFHVELGMRYTHHPFVEPGHDVLESLNPMPRLA